MLRRSRYEKRTEQIFCTRSGKWSENRSSRFEPKILLISFSRGSGPPLRVDLNPRISKICASWMSVWNISANYVLVPLKFNLNWNIWKPFLKTSPLDFSGQRLGSMSLVVFLRFDSFSQVVKWSEFVRLYTTNSIHVHCQIRLTDRGPLCLREVLGSLPTGNFVLCIAILFYIPACILSSKTNNFGKDFQPKLPDL